MTAANATPAANTVPKSDSGGKLALGWMPVADSGESSSTKLVRADDERLAGGGGGGTWSHPTGNPVTLANGAEVTVTHPSAATHEVVVSVWESIPGLNVNFAPTNMTGASAPSPYVASDDGNYSPAWNLFDGGDVSEYNVYGQGFPASPRWAKLDLGSGNTRSLHAYSLKTHYTNGAFSEWKIQGSNDGSTWTDLDHQTGQGSWTVDVARTFTLSSDSAAYRYFRLYGIDGPSNANMTELKLFYLADPSVEPCTVGQYSSSQQFGVRRASATTTTVKNLSGSEKTVYINVVTP